MPTNAPKRISPMWCPPAINPIPICTCKDTYWNYYEADAVQRAYIDHVLREITGDPSFMAA